MGYKGAGVYQFFLDSISEKNSTAGVIAWFIIPWS